MTATIERPPADQPAATTTAADRGPAAPAPGAGFRPDLDALRAVAIVLVVAYHAHLERFDGGFVGVDVFFVISGFLITRNLLVERERTGRVALGAFWARRLRRLVPAMTAMVVVTLLVGAAVLTPLEWGDLWRRGVAASLYVSNVVFARQSQGYFALDVDQSPFLHTWSLSVEEQFYVVWPVAVGLLLAAGTRRRGRHRGDGDDDGHGTHRRPTATPIVVGLTAVGAASFLWSVAAVDRTDPMAFYGLPSRAWEFAAAGLLAVAATRIRGRLHPAVALATVAAGLGTLAWTTLAYDGATRFPGLAAVPPVAATLAIVAAGTWSEAPWRLAFRPLRWIGRVSYSWYLWHWPAMVLAVAWLDRDTPAIRATAGLVSLGVATVSLRRLEDPVRRAPRLVGSTRATLAMALACTLVAGAAAGGVWAWGQRPFPRELAAAASKDYLAACSWSATPEGNRTCTVGDPDGARTVLLTGDSHAMSWVPGFDRAGRTLGIRVLVRAKDNCPGAPVGTISAYSAELFTGCIAYRDATRRIIEAEQPDVVILTSADFTRRVADADGRHVPDRDVQLALWADAIRGLRADLADEGIDLGVVLDNPRPDGNPLLCAGESGTAEGCGRSQEAATAKVARHVANERSAVGADRAMDTISLACRDDECPARLDGVWVYSDATHLSRQFTAAHADAVAAFLGRFPALAS